MTNKHRYGWLLCGHRCALMGCFTAALTGVNDIGSGLSSREPTAGVSGQRTVVRQKNKDKREGEIWGNGDKMDGNASGQAKTKSIHIKMQDHTHTHTHIRTPTLWFMQTESVSSRDLSSPEGLRGNQTEYLRQASLIPLVRLKSHSHTHTPHTHTGPRAHTQTHTPNYI